MLTSYVKNLGIPNTSNILKFLFIIYSTFPLILSDKLRPGDIFQVCHTTQPDYNNCIIKSLDNLRPALVKGIPKLKIPSVEPMIVPRILIRQGSGAVSIDSTFTNQKFHGITNYTIKSLKADPENYKIEFDVFLPWLFVEGDYTIKGQILVLPISGNGDSWSNYTTVDGKATLKGHPEIRHDKKYFKLDDFKFNINVQSARVQMNNLFNGNKQLGDAMNRFMGENWEVVFQELKPVVDESISVLLKDVAEKVFNKFTYDELFPK